MLQRSLGLLATLLASFANAQVTFKEPVAGAVIADPTNFNVNWKLEGTYTTYILQLCAGGNTEGSYIPLFPLTTKGTFAMGDSIVGKVQSLGLGDDIKNAYFLSMEAQGPSGSVTTFSSRFTLKGMKGTFPPAIAEAAKAVTGTDGPAKKDNTAAQPVDPGAAQFDVPWGSQTGNVRYAPMMKVPPTKVTKKDKSPLYPTSPYIIATTFLPTATIATTITQSQTFSVASRENTVAPAAQPTDDMSRFLARWKD